MLVKFRKHDAFERAHAWRQTNDIPRRHRRVRMQQSSGTTRRFTNFGSRPRRSSRRSTEGPGKSPESKRTHSVAFSSTVATTGKTVLVCRRSATAVVYAVHAREMSMATGDSCQSFCIIVEATCATNFNGGEVMVIHKAPISNTSSMGGTPGSQNAPSRIAFNTLGRFREPISPIKIMRHHESREWICRLVPVTPMAAEVGPHSAQPYVSEKTRFVAMSAEFHATT